ncbi:hypothetical protein QZH41_003046 [Actinostola sp. cb2023]|nr:hypothetical protein QZH41_003046 [Actinostola sp. cb2023]
MKTQCCRQLMAGLVHGLHGVNVVLVVMVGNSLDIDSVTNLHHYMVDKNVKKNESRHNLVTLTSVHEFFQYRIEADGASQYGGIFNAPKSYSFTSTTNQQNNIKLVKNFNNIDTKSNLASRMPRLGLTADILLSTASTTNDASGSIIYNGASRVYLPNVKPNPGVVRYWMREGTRRSCNDIKVHGVRAGQTYKDGYYMIRVINEYQYLPVFCDMTSEPGAFTLIVTSRHNQWTRAQVPARNVFTPSLNNDYSILKYADMIKNLGNNATFEYKLDANERGHWGGVWSALHAYSFMAENNKQTTVVLKANFGNWVYSWWNSLNPRMPWYNAKEKSTKALLTTSVNVDYYPSGSIIWGHSDKHPASWIAMNGTENPGVIWYWVNEDDCDTNRQPGGFPGYDKKLVLKKSCDPSVSKHKRFISSKGPGSV